MIDFILRNLARLALWLRYRIRVEGLDEIAARGRSGILFLPNHPALLDPIIMMTVLRKRFAPRAVADRDQIDRFLIRWIARRWGVRPLQSVADVGAAGRDQVEQVLADSIEGLRNCENLLIYPAGRTYRSRREDLRGNSAASTLMQNVPEARVVLARTTGLWGSRFSRASGRAPRVAEVLRFGILRLLASFIFFAPRREITITFEEPHNLPDPRDRAALNAYLEAYYNAETPPATRVPYTPWDRGGVRELPEPERRAIEGSVEDVPPATRRIVEEKLAEITGTADLDVDSRLAYDLGMDSIARAELLTWLSSEFGFPGTDVDALATVGDVMLAATGQSVGGGSAELRTVPDRWFANRDRQGRLALAEGSTVAESFLAQARRGPDRAVIADQNSGVLTYRDLVVRVMLLRPHIAALEGECVGIMLPASVGATVVYLATVMAGKTPVMINWTVGLGNLQHSLDLVGVRRIITADALVRRVGQQGVEFGELTDRFFILESLGRRIKLHHKLWAALRARLTWRSLRRAKVTDTAAILFTSGSETRPKAVPLRHANVTANLRAVLEHVPFYESDRLIGFLPPFHSFGLIANVLAPLCTGLQAAYHANPTEGAMLARLIAAYRATVMLGTPTFLSGIVRSATGEQLQSLRMAVTGAEKCPPRTYQAVAERCPQATILEGYGVTECSPIISANTMDDPHEGTIGRPLPGYQIAIVEPESEDRRVDRGEKGMLLVRGPSVFDGYLHHDGESPFVQFEGKQWYRTGDLVSQDGGGVLTFRGRLKRFEKIGGEMISLPAIEAALEPHLGSDGADDDGPTFAVLARPGTDPPQLVLVTTARTDRELVNAHIRDAGLSPLHNIREVVSLEEIPTLGTGKTDYRALADRLGPGG